MVDNILELEDLQTHFFTDLGTVKAVDGVSFRIGRGKTVGIVGESGSGKSITAMSILHLISRPGRIVSGRILFNDGNETVDLAAMAPHSPSIRAIRGNSIAMIFQEPMNSLSPVHTIGQQIIEGILLHTNMNKQQARQHAIEMLRFVGIADPARNIDSYTFQLSGGMRQRAMIAAALACNPSLLIADEPTTALDVTTQAQILDLIKRIQDERGMAVMLITHDLGVVAEVCDEVVVMYLGEVVERAQADELFGNPLHPYTRALLNSLPVLGAGRDQNLEPIAGSVPDIYSRPAGCPFHDRCPAVVPGLCEHHHPDLVELPGDRMVRCVHYENKVAT